MMKNNTIVIILLLHSILIFGQEQEHVDLLETDSTWGKEIFKFPLSFAKEIPYEGIEEARFPKNWAKRDSSDFWSYAFVWSININAAELTEKELETDLQTYFDGLMRIKEKRDNEVFIQSTVALFLEKNDAKESSQYIGKVRTHDAFFDKKPMTLNVLVEKHYCEQQKKTIVLFRFSPKEFGHDIWLKLGEVKARPNICEL